MQTSQDWLHQKSRKEGLSIFSKSLQKQFAYCMDVKKDEERSTKKKEHDNIESKKQKPKKGTVLTIACKQAHTQVVYHQPYQVTLCKNWGETSIVNRWEIEKKNKLCICLRSGINHHHHHHHFLFTLISLQLNYKQL